MSNEVYMDLQLAKGLFDSNVPVMFALTDVERRGDHGIIRFQSYVQLDSEPLDMFDKMRSETSRKRVLEEVNDQKRDQQAFKRTYCKPESGVSLHCFCFEC